MIKQNNYFFFQKNKAKHNFILFTKKKEIITCFLNCGNHVFEMRWACFMWRDILINKKFRYHYSHIFSYATTCKHIFQVLLFCSWWVEYWWCNWRCLTNTLSASKLLWLVTTTSSWSAPSTWIPSIHSSFLFSLEFRCLWCLHSRNIILTFIGM